MEVADIVKTTNLLEVFFVMLIVSLPFSFAAGGGGGGSSNPKPACSKDTFSCSEWGECNSQGEQMRTCTMTYDCTEVETEKPAEKEGCTYVSKVLSSLKCHNLGTMKERISCRLGLSDKDLENELEIAYLPEECRSITFAGDKEECVLLYSRSQQCWGLAIGNERNNCLKNLMKVKDLKEDRKNCKNDNQCINSLRKNAYALIKFGFYDLEERAEWLYEKGIITKEKAVDVIASLEEEKINFNNAKTKEERKQSIMSAKELWKNFILL